ncbi:MAG TPA: MFS transporter [Beijerinckiaceae bacterium]|nr:MFS transporter [Beijerinckiaceae bacterium]
MLVLVVFLIAYIFSQFYRSCLAVIAADLARDLGLGPAELGHLTAIWFITFSLAQFPIGYLLDRHGPRRTAALIMLVAVAGAALFSQATSFAMALVGMGLVGIGCAPILMAALYYFGRTTPPERFPFYVSILVGVGNLGNILGARPLAQSVALIGWRSSLLLIAVATLAAACAVFFTVRDPERVAAPNPGGNALSELWQVISFRTIWPLYLLTFVSYATIAAERGLWIGPFLEKVHGLDALARGDAAFFMALGMAMGALTAGPLVNVLGTMKRVAIMGTSGAILGFGTLALVPGLGATLTVAILFLTGLFGMCYGIILSHARLFFPAHLLGRGVTFVNFLSIGGAGVALSLSGLFVRAAELRGEGHAAIFSSLHMIFASALVIALAYYLTAPATPRDTHKTM